ncbi:MAG: hypothetical protein H0X43_13640 [Nitrosospira sp.]|nr:hypothetical protein [Nitrosospira sp.]
MKFTVLHEKSRGGLIEPIHQAVSKAGLTKLASQPHSGTIYAWSKRDSIAHPEGRAGERDLASDRRVLPSTPSLAFVSQEALNTEEPNAEK